MRTSALAFLAIAAALCSTSSPVLAARSQKGQLSDANLFEVHLQKPASGHKRLPSEILRDHHERDELVELEDEQEEEILATAAPATVTASLTYGPSSTAPGSSPQSTSSSTTAPAQITFSPRQPSHFIKHRRQRFAKRRLADAQIALQMEEESQDSRKEAEQAASVVTEGQASIAKAARVVSRSINGERRYSDSTVLGVLIVTS